MAAGENFSLAAFAVAVDRADGVDDEFCGKASGGGDDGFAGSEAADFCHDGFALGEDRWTAGAMNGAVDASAAEERGVGSVHDGVGSFLGDVGGAVEGDGLGVGEEEAHGAENNSNAESRWARKTTKKQIPPCGRNDKGDNDENERKMSVIL